MRLSLERRQGYGGWFPRLTNVEDRAPHSEGGKWVAAFTLPEGPVEVWVQDPPPSAREVAEAAEAFSKSSHDDPEAGPALHRCVDRWIRAGRP